jgi:hypothetical protein
MATTKKRGPGRPRKAKPQVKAAENVRVSVEIGLEDLPFLHHVIEDFHYMIAEMFRGRPVFHNEMLHTIRLLENYRNSDLLKKLHPNAQERADYLARLDKIDLDAAVS